MVNANNDNNNNNNKKRACRTKIYLNEIKRVANL